MAEVYVVYGMGEELNRILYGAFLGCPDFMFVFDNKQAAIDCFRHKVTSIARSETLKKSFSHLSDEELFVDTFCLRHYTSREIEGLPVFIRYKERDDEIEWTCYQNELDYDTRDAMAPRVYMVKRNIDSNLNSNDVGVK